MKKICVPLYPKSLIKHQNMKNFINSVWSAIVVLFTWLKTRNDDQICVLLVTCLGIICFVYHFPFVSALIALLGWCCYTQTNKNK